MRPAMTEREMILFDSLVRSSRRYVEFGAGGSTCRAASTNKEWLISVDSSAEWLSKVAAQCEGEIRVKLLHADIGRVGDWGTPVDVSRRHDWPSYHERPWLEPEAVEGDLFFIDGRFRVACFIQTVLRAASPDAILAMHDFADRPHYHVVRPFVREIAVTEQLSVFIRRPDLDRSAAARVLQQYLYEFA